MEGSSLTEIDWFFYKIVASKHCPIKDILVLKNIYSLPDLLILKEYVEMLDDLERARSLDDKAKLKHNQRE